MNYFLSLSFPSLFAPSRFLPLLFPLDSVTCHRAAEKSVAKHYQLSRVTPRYPGNPGGITRRKIAESDRKPVISRRPRINGEPRHVFIDILGATPSRQELAKHKGQIRYSRQGREETRRDEMKEKREREREETILHGKILLARSLFIRHFFT